MLVLVDGKGYDPDLSADNDPIVMTLLTAKPTAGLRPSPSSSLDVPLQLKPSWDPLVGSLGDAPAPRTTQGLPLDTAGQPPLFPGAAGGRRGSATPVGLQPLRALSLPR
jgi:hypothetical protein